MKRDPARGFEDFVVMMLLPRTGCCRNDGASDSAASAREERFPAQSQGSARRNSEQPTGRPRAWRRSVRVHALPKWASLEPLT